MEDLSGARGPLASWRLLADAWCAAWFWPAGAPPPSSRAPGPRSALRCVADASGLPARSNANGGRRPLPSRRRERFFHWQLEFPEIFFDAGGQPLERPGFDAVIGNPPWADAHAARRRSAASRAVTHCRDGGHANLYQLFAERMLQLTARGGRDGMLMPSGLLADHGCAALRSLPVRALRGGRRPRIRQSRRAVSDPSRSAFSLDHGDPPADRPAELRVPVRDSIRRAARGRARYRGPARRRHGPADAGAAIQRRGASRCRNSSANAIGRVLARMLSRGTASRQRGGLGRALRPRAQRDRRCRAFRPQLVCRCSRASILDPFSVRVEEARRSSTRLRRPASSAGARRFDRPRLGYREVASSTNRLTLIAAVVPAGRRSRRTQSSACGTARTTEAFTGSCAASSTASWRTTWCDCAAAHIVPAAVIHQLPVPVLPQGRTHSCRIASLARAAARDAGARAEVQAIERTSRTDSTRRTSRTCWNISARRRRRNATPRSRRFAAERMGYSFLISCRITGSP